MYNNNLEYTSTRNHGTKTPYSTSEYRQELEAIDYCNDSLITVYLNLTGMLIRMIELGSVDILHEASLISQYMALPRLGHLQQALNIFKYIKADLNQGWLIFDTLDYDIEWNPMRPNEVYPTERAVAMKELYHETKYPIPYIIPKALGNEANINCFVDSDYDGNSVTRLSHSRVMIYVNMAPIKLH